MKGFVRSVVGVLVACILSASHAFACVNPAGTAGEVIVNEAYNVPQYCDGTNWVAMTASKDDTYKPNAVEFDALGDILGVSSPNSFSDSTQLTASFWFFNSSVAEFIQTFFWLREGSGHGCYIEPAPVRERIICTFEPVGATSPPALFFDTPMFMFKANRWHHFLFSVDTTDVNKRRVFANGVDITGSVNWVNYGGTMNLDYSDNHPQDSIYIGSRFAGPNRQFLGYMADMWVSDTYIDLSDINNVRKFISADRNPVYLGGNGELPTGSPPDIFLSGPTDDWHTNKGTGGGFTELGPLTTAPSSPYSPRTEVVPSGLVGHWRLDEMSGTTASDSTINKFNGTYDVAVSGADTSPGVISNAIDFGGTGTTRYVSVPSNSTLTSLRDVSVAFWVKPEAEGGYRGLLDIGPEGSGVLQLAFAWNSNDLMIVPPLWNGTDGDFRAGNAGRLNEWRHIAVTYSYNDPVGTHPKVYVNGSPVSTGVAGLPTGSVSPPPSAALTIGRVEFSASGRFIEAKMDDVRLYNRVLTAAEVREIYEAEDGIRYNVNRRAIEYFDGNKFMPMTAQKAGPSDGLVGHWPLDENTGAVAADISGNGNNGAMQNGLAAPSNNNFGAIGTGLRFDGIDDYVEVPTNGIFNAVPVTVSGWIKLDQLPSVSGKDAPIIYADSAGSGYAYKIQVDNNGNSINFSVSDSGGTDFFVDSDQPAVVGRWYHVVGRLDAAYNLSLFVNGVLQADTANSVSRKAADRPLRFGESGGDSVQGIIDDLRIYSRALSDAEIQSLFQMGTPVGETTALPQGCPNIGDVCDDGTIYAGLSPDGDVPMFTTLTDAFPTQTSEASWNWTFTSGNPDTMADCTDNPPGTSATCRTGAANTALLVGIDADTNAAGFQRHRAATYCFNLVANGSDDWYLPAQDEMNVIADNKTVIPNLTLSGDPRYWTSSEDSSATARWIDMDAANPAFDTNGANKNNGYLFRCVRKGPAPRCANPYGLEGRMIYNEDYDAVQYCDGARWRKIGG